MSHSVRGVRQSSIILVADRERVCRALEPCGPLQGFRQAIDCRTAGVTQAQADRLVGALGLFRLGGREILGSPLWIGVISPTRRCRSTAASLTQARAKRRNRILFSEDAPEDHDHRGPRQIPRRMPRPHR